MVDGRHVALQDVQVGAADRYRVDADHRVGGFDDRGLGTSSRGAAGTGVHGCFHRNSSGLLSGDNSHREVEAADPRVIESGAVPGVAVELDDRVVYIEE